MQNTPRLGFSASQRVKHPIELSGVPLEEAGLKEAWSDSAYDDWDMIGVEIHLVIGP
jgi:hypothetical protein